MIVMQGGLRIGDVVREDDRVMQGVWMIDDAMREDNSDAGMIDD